MLVTYGRGCRLGGRSPPTLILSAFRSGFTDSDIAGKIPGRGRWGWSTRCLGVIVIVPVIVAVHVHGNEHVIVI
jgi:hypothetical protein